MAMILFYPRPPILPPLPSLELLDCVHVFSSLKSMMRKKNLLFCAPFPRPAHGPSDWDSFPLGKLPLGEGRRHGVALSLAPLTAEPISHGVWPGTRHSSLQIPFQVRTTQAA